MKRQREGGLRSDFFTGLKFALPIPSPNLSRKRVQLLSKLIALAGGEVTSAAPGVYLIVQPFSIPVLRQKLAARGLQLDLAISDSFVTDCLNRKQLLPVQEYLIFAETASSDMKLEEASVAQLDRKKKVAVRVQSDRTVNIQSKTVGKSLQEQAYPPGIKLVDLQTPKVQVLKPEVDSARRAKNQEYWNERKGRFVCQKGATAGLNDFVCEQLEKLQKIYQTEKDKGRSIAYRKAASAVRTVQHPITGEEDVDHLHGVGPKIRQKILQIVRTGRLAKLEALQSEQKHRAVTQLSRVWGIGTATALSLFGQGISTIQQLRERQELLSKNQRIGLRYVQQFEERMGRAEVQQIEQVVRRHALQINPFVTMQTCGSYRRGKETCGDVDIIFTEKDGEHDPEFLGRLVRSLEGELLTDHLAGQSGVSSSYMGVCLLPGSIHRRIDLKQYPIHEFAFATLYFTGSDMFNRSMRLFARKKGFSLSDRALVPVERVQGQKRWEGSEVVCFTEMDVFEALGLQYRRPEQRSV